ncbi:MAG: hypothetical protein E7H79_01330 [Clostridium perfringens]|nr:hypothetical protein [Clostridium perfringens]
MKKIISFLILCVISVGLIGCSKDNKTVDNLLSNKQVEKQVIYNEIAKTVYNQLPKEQKEEINLDYKQIDIDKTILKENMGNISDNSYIEKEVYVINFTLKDKNTKPNNRIVYATLDENKVIGYRYVE